MRPIARSMLCSSRLVNKKLEKVVDRESSFQTVICASHAFDMLYSALRTQTRMWGIVPDTLLAE